MKKFFRKHGRTLQIFYISAFFIALIVMGCSKEKSPYADLNNHHSSEIMRIETDTINVDSIVYHFYLKNSYGNYETIQVDPDWAVLFEEGDIL